MLQRPSLPEDENDHAARLYLDGNNLVAELNMVALANFRWSLWGLAVEYPLGEDIDIWAKEAPTQNQDHAKIHLCEITLTDIAATSAEFLHRGDRMDLFVNREQAEEAYKNLEALTGTEIGQEATLFGRLIVRVVQP